MPHLVRLTYASKTASTPATIRQDLTAILEEARQHNFNQQVHGVLFYGNDHFYQCLEGRKVVVDALYEKILNDPRHYQVQLLSYMPIDYSTFQNWNMKYVRQEEEVRDFFMQRQRHQFNPYIIKDTIQDEFLALLLKEHDYEVGQTEVVIGKEHAVRGHALHLKYLVVILSIALVACMLVYYFFNVQ